jgi:hypothetical protein
LIGVDADRLRAKWWGSVPYSVPATAVGRFETIRGRGVAEDT